MAKILNNNNKFRRRNNGEARANLIRQVCERSLLEQAPTWKTRQVQHQNKGPSRVSYHHYYIPHSSMGSWSHDHTIYLSAL